MGLFSFLFGKPQRPASPAVVSVERPTSPPPPPAPRIRWRSDSFPLHVVGESRYQNALIAICGPHTRQGHEGEYEAVLEREPLNQFDPNAVMVKIRGMKIGYLEREQAERFSKAMLEAELRSVRCGARIRGGWRTNQHDEGSYGVRLAAPGWGWIDLGVGANPPPPPPRAPRKPSTLPQPAATGPLAGQRIALIGAARDSEQGARLASLGARVVLRPGKTTTILAVVADRPFSLGVTRSQAYIEASRLIADGSKMEILTLTEVLDRQPLTPDEGDSSQ